MELSLDRLLGYLEAAQANGKSPLPKVEIMDLGLSSTMSLTLWNKFFLLFKPQFT